MTAWDKTAWEPPAEETGKEARMAQKRRAHAFGAKFITVMAICASPGLMALAAGGVGVVSWWVAGPIFGAALIAAILASFKLMASFRCGVCGSLLPPPKRWYAAHDNAPLVFKCKECDVTWDVGLRGSND